MTFLLLRKSFKTPEEALKSPATLIQHPVPVLGNAGHLYLAPAVEHEPRWFDFLREGTSTPLPPLTGGVPAGVLFIQSSSRLFAVTFGQGRHLLKPETFELDFGLKVTLNTADPARLRSVDLRTFEELTVHTRRQVSRGSSLDAFSVDVTRDLLRAFTGEPRDLELAKRFTGKDALVLNGTISFANLPKKCARLLQAFESQDYLTTFPWVDNIQAIRDSAQVNRLNERMLQLLKDGKLEKAHLAPPDMVGWEEVAGFHYPGERGQDMHPDMELEECLHAIAASEQVRLADLTLTVDDLKRYAIRAVYDESSREVERWPFYNCLVLELDLEDALYVLSSGQWFRIEKLFVTDIEKKAARLARDMPSLPTARANQKEGAYNLLASQASRSLALLDEKLIQCTGARTRVEACDLFSSERQFIHVKRKTRSSTLSHLFSQGLISAEVFLKDAGFRKALKERVKRARPSLAQLLGDPLVKPVPGEFEIIFAIITGATQAQWPLSLPFFSLLNLTIAAERLELLGFKVGICHIDEQKRRTPVAA
ncbi:TIGR04141 family sporadically distributed protein [Hyalangium gracile]|uniref:TIGR04141 family sporadically distributed protein n=1 Tax=Hyalangium gracile TaxID=394092 RepID=UPI001CCE5090|nr:TIGR04141 family sporadically distributed protein [Hyalangium gracile]